MRTISFHAHSAFNRSITLVRNDSIQSYSHRAKAYPLLRTPEEREEYLQLPCFHSHGKAKFILKKKVVVYLIVLCMTW